MRGCGDRGPSDFSRRAPIGHAPGLDAQQLRTQAHAEVGHLVAERLGHERRFLGASGPALPVEHRLGAAEDDQCGVDQRNMSAVLSEDAAKEKSPPGFDARGLSLYRDCQLTR